MCSLVLLTVHTTYEEVWDTNLFVCYRFSPGASPDALTVGGSQQHDELYLRLFDGTNYGSCVDIFAPGEDITSAGLSRPDAVATFSGTSQATPIVSGAAAVYWSINSDATPQDIRDDLISTCTRDRLQMDVVPSSFRDKSPNCLLRINKNYHQPKPYQVYYSVPSTEFHHVIAEMETNLYALIYIHSHQVNSSDHYSMIFKYMADVEFKTVTFTASRRLERVTAKYRPKGFQLTLIFAINTTEFIAVFQNTKVKYSNVFRESPERHLSIYEQKTSHNESLIYTNVIKNRNNNIRYTSVYLVDSFQVTEHLPSLSISNMSETLQSLFNKGYQLSDLSNIPTNPPTVSIVCTQMTGSSENYKSYMELELDETKERVEAHLRKGFAPLVVVGMNTSDGLKFYVSLISLN